MPINPLEIQLLGGFQIRRGSRVIPNDAWKLRKAAGIVKLLALTPGHRLHREQMLDTLWPELEAEAAANNFRYALHTARQILNPDGENAGRILYREGSHLVLAEPGTIWVDVAAFETALGTAWKGDDPALHQATVRLYTGDLLPADRYDEWLDGRRTALRTSYLALLTRLANLHQERGDRAAALATWQLLVAAEPTHEEAHTRLMMLHAHSGNRQEALAQYDRLVHALDHDLGIAPDPVTQQLADAIREGHFTGSPAPADRERAEPRTNLPAQITPLLGRERELSEIRQALSRARLVTLTGPGGAGKTRLALAAAHDARNSFNDGVFLVELAPVQQPGLIATATVQALGIREESGQAAEETLVGFLRERALLLVFDNFEHVVSGAALVRALLEACPAVTILTTSRVPLKLRGEQEYPVRPLADDASTALFIQRAREVKPDFEPDAGQTAVITRICQRLDGLPLAIELAAARSKVLPPQALLARLEHPLTLLTSGPRDLPERQRTLRDTIAWSYNLLQPHEQALFQALSIFVGGWSLDAAEAIGGDGIDVLDTLTALVESSLIDESPGLGGEPRFGMLETIREFGLEQLVANGEDSAVRGRHARYMLTLVEAAEALLQGPEMIVWLDRLEQEHANIQAALDWFARVDDVEEALRMAGILWHFWWMRGHWTIGRRYYDTLLGRADDTIQPATLAGALTGAGIMADWENNLEWDRTQAMNEQALSIGLSLPNPPFHIFWNYVLLGYVAVRRGDLQSEREYYEAMLDIATKLGNTQGLGMAFHNLAHSAFVRGDLEHAIAQYHEALRYFGSGGSIWGTNVATGALGYTLLLIGRYDDARPHLEKALALNQLMGHTRDIAGGMNLLGMLELHEGRLTEAVELLDRGLTIAQDIGDRRLIAEAKIGLGNIARRQGTIQAAAQLFQEGLRNALTCGDVAGIATAVEGLAAISNDDRDPRRATQLYASASAYREETGAALAGVQKADVETALARLHASLTEDAFDAAWAVGSLLTPDEILAGREAGHAG